MMNLRNDFTLRAIVFRRLAGKTQQNVIEIVDAVVGGPLDQLEVAHAGRVLAHELENVSRQTLDAGLNRKQSALAHLPELRATETGPHFVMQTDVGVGFTEPAEEFLDILGRDDVVDGVEVENAVAA